MRKNTNMNFFSYFALNRLTNVFFSNIVLNEVGASAYKVAIEDALENCRVLVSIATKKEYLESKWVSYERESFHNDILSGRKNNACIVPFLKNIYGIDVPRSLRNFQTFQIVIEDLTHTAYMTIMISGIITNI